MSYSIKVQLHPHIGKEGLQQVVIRIISDRNKTVIPTGIKVNKKNFNNGAIINRDNSDKMNLLIKRKVNEVEGKLLNALQVSDKIGKDGIKSILKNAPQKIIFIEDFICTLETELKGKLSNGRLRHYVVIKNKLREFDIHLRLDQMNVQRLQDFETWIRVKGISGNTVQTNMKIIKSILYKAAEKGLIKKDLFEAYKLPAYKETLPEYLSEEEINKLHDFVERIEKPGHKLAGYYFLLSCYSGLRISDAKAFDYKRMVQGDNIVIRARKNNSLVSIYIYPKLRQILDYIKDKPLNLSEEKTRQYVKELCSFIGISKQVKYHTSRHSFAMLFMKKKFTIDEVGDLLGDSEKVARVYARIHPEVLNEKIKERFQ